MANSVVYDGVPVVTTQRGENKIILTITATGRNTFSCNVVIQKLTGPGETHWRVQTNHELYLYYRGVNDASPVEHAIGISGKLVEVQNYMYGIANIATDNVVLNPNCSISQRVIAAHYHAYEINASKDTYDFWAPGDVATAKVPEISNVWVRQSGKWVQAQNVYCRSNGSWVESATGGVKIRKDASWKA